MAKPRIVPPRLLAQVVLFLALVITVASYHSVLTGVGWLFVVGGVVAVVSLAMGISHRIARHAVWPPVAGLVAAVLSVTVFFAPTSALLFLIPTFGTFGQFRSLVTGGMESIAVQGTPAEPTVGIVFLLGAGLALVTVIVDVLAFTLRRPAFVGIPLLALVAVPALIDTTVNDPVFFVLVAAAYLVLLITASERRLSPAAAGVGAAAIAGALVLSVLLPSVSQTDSPSSRLRSYSTGVNPFINLGADLRRPQPITALTYTTTSKRDQYFTLSVLENFGDGEWHPTIDDSGRRNLDDIGPVPGRSSSATVARSTTKVQVGNVIGNWLPVPFAPTSITGLSGSWSWDPSTLSIRSRNSSMLGQDYTVKTEIATPSAQELNAIRTRDNVASLSTDLDLPSDLPAIVGRTAKKVVADAGATTEFEQAMALQDYFRGPDFTYSTDAPVEQGYDGSSARVIGEFLQKKAGYCVHFSSAMATMARSLGIPARIGVGFTSGIVEAGTDTATYTVSTDDLHAWPELYFDTIGWVRFEPTPGRGTVPNFGSLQADNPATPDVDESTQTPTPTTAPSKKPTDAATPAPAPSSASGSAATDLVHTVTTVLVWVGVALVVVLLLLLPAIVRASRRSRRLGRVRAGGSALDAWAEVRDTAIDLGYAASDAETPRAFASALSAVTATPGADPLARLLAAVEARAYGPGPGSAANVADVRAVLAALGGFAARGARWRARLAPASVLSRVRRADPEE